jgi:hypothetical protein
MRLSSLARVEYKSYVKCANISDWVDLAAVTTVVIWRVDLPPGPISECNRSDGVELYNDQRKIDHDVHYCWHNIRESRKEYRR